MRRSWLIIPLLVVLAAGCGVGPQAGPPSGPWVEPVPPDQQASAASGAPDGPPEITLAFGGDVHFVEYDGGVPNRTWQLLDDPDTAFGPVAELFHDADLSMINLETAVTTGGTPEPKTFLFRAPPEAFDAVRAAGIDVVSLANNHALDYGRDGLADSLATPRRPAWRWSAPVRTPTPRTRRGWSR